jgi:hypothetical protein
MKNDGAGHRPTIIENLWLDPIGCAFQYDFPGICWLCVPINHAATASRHSMIEFSRRANPPEN